MVAAPQKEFDFSNLADAVFEDAPAPIAICDAPLDDTELQKGGLAAPVDNVDEATAQAIEKRDGDICMGKDIPSFPGFTCERLLSDIAPAPCHENQQTLEQIYPDAREGEMSLNDIYQMKPSTAAATAPTPQQYRTANAARKDSRKKTNKGKKKQKKAKAKGRPTGKANNKRKAKAKSAPANIVDERRRHFDDADQIFNM